MLFPDCRLKEREEDSKPNRRKIGRGKRIERIMKDMYLQHMVCTRKPHNHLSMFLDRKLTTELYQKNIKKTAKQKKKKKRKRKQI